MALCGQFVTQKAPLTHGKVPSGSHRAGGSRIVPSRRLTRYIYRRRASYLLNLGQVSERNVLARAAVSLVYRPPVQACVYCGKKLEDVLANLEYFILGKSCCYRSWMTRNTYKCAGQADIIESPILSTHLGPNANCEKHQRPSKHQGRGCAEPFAVVFCHDSACLTRPDEAQRLGIQIINMRLGNIASKHGLERGCERKCPPISHPTASHNIILFFLVGKYPVQPGGLLRSRACMGDS